MRDWISSLAALALVGCKVPAPGDTDGTTGAATLEGTASSQGSTGSSGATTSGSSGGEGTTASPTTGGAAGRGFRLGFSPWPWDATVEAVDWTWENILAHGDVVSMHLEEGVPWPEALAGEPFPTNYQDKVDGELARIPAETSILLSINAMNSLRTGLAPYRGEADNQPLPPPWDGRGFGSPEVVEAYANYAERMIAWVRPTWVLIGIEVNVLINNDAAQWADYAALVCATYGALRERGVTQPMLVSLVAPPFFPGTTNDALDDQLAVLADLDACVDGFALSVHPFMSSLLADSFPEDYFDQLATFSDRWVGISESSYPAQQWSLDGLTWTGTPEKQDAFVERLLTAARAMKLEFAVWFTIRDYDPLWAGPLGMDPSSLIWRDTGFFGEDGLPRPALTRWDAALAEPFTGG